MNPYRVISIKATYFFTSAYFRYWWLQNSLEDKNHSYRLLSSQSFKVRHNFPNSNTLCFMFGGEEETGTHQHKKKGNSFPFSLSCCLEFLNSRDLALIEAFIVWKGATTISKLKYLHSFLLALLNPARCCMAPWTVPAQLHTITILLLWRKVFWRHIEHLNVFLAVFGPSPHSIVTQTNLPFMSKQASLSLAQEFSKSVVSASSNG